jgi:hypothetical protein
LGLSQRRGPWNPRRPLYWARAPWALGPSRLRVLGGGRLALALVAAALAPPLGRRPRWLEGGVRCSPSSLYKGTPRGRSNHNFPMTRKATSSPPTSLVHRPPPWPLPFTSLSLSLSLSLSHVVSQSAVQDRDHTTVARRRAAEFSDSIQHRLIPQSWLDRRFQRSSWSPYVCKFVELLLVWHRSRCSKIFTTLRSATSSSSSMLVRERNPHVRSTKVCHRTSVYCYDITSR